MTEVGPSRTVRHRETAILRAVQDTLAAPAVLGSARGLSLFGEHAAGWLVVGALGAVLDRRRRGDWMLAASGVAVAHGLSVGVKRVVRRRRPDDSAVRTLVSTPSALSFPSAHAASTTAASVVYGALTGRRLTPVLVPPMLVSRLVLGVHFPTDVLAGSVLGAAVAAGVRRLLSSPASRDPVSATGPDVFHPSTKRLVTEEPLFRRWHHHRR
ncbi:MAG: phosphatase PAP2 family protein [Sciscionella sp.]